MQVYEITQNKNECKTQVIQINHEYFQQIRIKQQN